MQSPVIKNTGSTFYHASFLTSFLTTDFFIGRCSQPAVQPAKKRFFLNSVALRVDFSLPTRNKKTCRQRTGLAVYEYAYTTTLHFGSLREIGSIVVALKTS